MKVILTALGLRGDGHEEEQAWEMMTVGDRPWLQHQIEHLATCGVRDLTLILHHDGESIEKLVSDGARWGMRVDYRLAREAQRPLACLRGSEFTQPVVVGSSLVLAPPEILDTENVAYSYSDDRGVAFPWLRLEPQQVLEAASLNWEEMLQKWSPSQSSGSARLALQSAQDVLDRNRDFLDKRWPLPALAREIEPGCWIGRDVVLHPTVTVHPPCLIGPHCRIGRGAQIGPYAVLGSGCLVEEHTRIKHSLVAPGTYLGAALELDEMMASPGVLRLADGEPLAIPDPSLIGNTRPSLGFTQGLQQRLLASLLLGLLAPLRWLARRQAARQPLRFVSALQPDLAEAWQEKELADCESTIASLREHFWRVFLPGLKACSQGQLAVVGLTPRDRSQLAAAPAYVRRRYLNAGPGLISEALVQFGVQAQEDERELAEACQVAERRLSYSLNLLWRYFLDVLMDAPRP